MARVLLLLLLLLVVVTACYSPDPVEGSPCETGSQCPTPQRCVAGACSSHDAASVAHDAAPADAAIDAALACTTDGLACSGGIALFTCDGSCWVRCGNRLPRAAARDICTAWHGHLGQIETAGEQACVARLVDSKLWIGLEQLASAGTVDAGWTWNGITFATLDGWNAGAPNDADRTENGAEQCAHVEPGGWDDEPCGDPHAFLCER